MSYLKALLAWVTENHRWRVIMTAAGTSYTVLSWFAFLSRDRAFGTFLCLVAALFFGCALVAHDRVRHRRPPRSSR